MSKAIALAAVLTLLTWSCGSGDAADYGVCPDAGCEISVGESVQYAGFYRGDVYAPVATGPWPIAVVAHGIFQSRPEFSALAEEIARGGAIVFNIDTADSSPFLTTIEHIACAVRFMRANSTKYGGDPRSVTLVGNSLGAATGAVVGFDGDSYEGDCIVSEGSAVPTGLVGYEGPYDYATHDYQQVNLIPLQDKDPSLWHAVNPYSHLGGNPDLVVRLIHGVDIDDIWYEVPTPVSVEFHDALLDAGYDVELTLLQGATHVDLKPGLEPFEVTVREVLEVARG